MSKAGEVNFTLEVMIDKDKAGEVNFTLKVMIDKDRTKVLFAEADGHFADILLSFMTVPLGRVVKLLEKHYGDEAPVIGSLNTLYHSLANLDPLHFWTEGAKLSLLNPKSSFELEYEKLKLDIHDSQPAEYFQCTHHTSSRIRCVSLYYDFSSRCRHISGCEMIKVGDEKGSGAASKDGVFTRHTETFIISDDLKILPSDKGPLGIISILGITETETDNAVPISVTFGFDEVMSLLKASLISPTALSDLILNKTRHMKNSLMVESKPEISIAQIHKEEDPSSKKMILKLMIQKCTGKLLYAQAKEDFVEFLFSFLHIPLGGVELKACNKAINNLYRSTSEFMNDEYFKTLDMKNRLIKLNMPHGCVSKNHILPITEESLPAYYSDTRRFSSLNFPKGKGSYLEGPRTYKVMDDLTVTPFRNVSIISGLSKMKVSISDVKEVRLQVGLKEALNILRASLTSTSALSDGLLNHISLRQPKQEL